MNKKIENGSWCLFKKYSGGTREGKIVLAQHYNIQDSEFGAGYTIKEYHSEKNISENSWSHKSIILKPLSFDSSFYPIELKDEELTDFKIIGEFITILNI